MFFLACVACETDPLIPDDTDVRCGRACFEGPEYDDVGRCSYGVLECSDEGYTCVGAVGPQEEACDGLDNDCDGLVDEDLTRQCETHEGFCTRQVETCVQGQWFCSAPKAEECNGYDDDCDGAVDENLPLTLSYSGPVSTLNVGECLPQVEYCTRGHSVVQEEVLPAEEVCDGLDNDCDGEVDNVDGQTHAILLVIDISGSMGGTIKEVEEALCTWPAGPTQFLVARVANDSGQLPYVDYPFMQWETQEEMCSHLHSIEQQNASGNEFMLEYLPEFEQAGWPDSESLRHVFFFTDEPVRTPTEIGEMWPDTTVDDVTAACADEGYDTYVMGYPDPKWTQIVAACGGRMDPLVPVAREIQMTLATWMGELCG